MNKDINFLIAIVAISLGMAITIMIASVIGFNYLTGFLLVFFIMLLTIILIKEYKENK